MAKKFYVVWRGRETGIFTDWNTCKKHVDKFPGARFKSFPTRAAAEAAFKGGAPPAGKPSGSDASANAGPKKPPAAGGVRTYSATEVAAMPIDTKIFTDGGCDPNPGQAGSGVAVYRDDQITELWYGLFNPSGTNNTAELNALHQALLMSAAELAAGNSVAIFCDSKYSIQCITHWAAGWESKGWVRKGGEIKNLDLIKATFASYQRVQDQIQIMHVNGHVGAEGNELADRMSMLAIESRQLSFAHYAESIDVTAILAMRAG